MNKNLSESEFQALRDFLAQAKGIPYLTVEMLLRTGIRQDELIRLDASHFVSRDGRHYVNVPLSKTRGKNKYRMIPLDSGFFARLAPFIDMKRPWGRLLSDSNSPATQKRAVRRAFHRVLTEAIGPHHYTAHGLRHTFAMRFLKKCNGDIVKTQQVMGHANINTTAIYAGLYSVEELEDDILDAVS